MPIASNFSDAPKVFAASLHEPGGESPAAYRRQSHFSPMNQPLAETIFWIAAIACVIAEIAILRSTFAARRIRKSELVPASSTAGELVWAVIPALALSAVLIATYRRIEGRDSHMQMMDHSRMQHSMPGTAEQPPAPNP